MKTTDQSTELQPQFLAAAEAIAGEQPQQQTEAIVATVCFRALSCMEPEKQQPSVKRLFS